MQNIESYVTRETVVLLKILRESFTGVEAGLVQPVYRCHCAAPDGRRDMTGFTRAIDRRCGS